MSSIKLAPHASGTGEFIIAAPNSNTSRTFNLPDSSGTIATAESTLTQFNASGSAPVYAARAWVNFNGTGTVAIRASGNVSSITDIGTGRFGVNFSTSMPDANYAVVATARNTSAGNTCMESAQDNTNTTSRVDLNCFSPGTGLVDPTWCSVSIFR